MSHTITIVDDSGELRFLFALLLDRELEFSCLSLESLDAVRKRAVEVLASESIILDINLGMNQPDGVAVYEWLKSQNYRGKVFFLTGHAKGSPAVQHAASTGVQILEKPMTPDDIVEMFRHLVNKQETA